MKGTEYLTKEAVLKKGREAIGIPLKDIDKKGRLATGKGAVGKNQSDGYRTRRSGRQKNCTGCKH